MQFIKLTDPNGSAVIVNPDYITAIRPISDDSKGGSFVATLDGKSMAVKESIEEVQQKIADAVNVSKGFQKTGV